MPRLWVIKSTPRTPGVSPIARISFFMSATLNSPYLCVIDVGASAPSCGMEPPSSATPGMAATLTTTAF